MIRVLILDGEPPHACDGGYGSVRAGWIEPNIIFSRALSH